jgi:hypothetical protein
MYSNNIAIYKFVDFVGLQLFRALWLFPDRRFVRAPNIRPVWEIYQAVISGRKHLSDRAVPDDKARFDPKNSRPSPVMFRVYPVPFFGNHGCVQPEFREWSELMLLMLTEAMKHNDNLLAFDVTQNFFEVVSPYLQRVLVQMATQYFGFTREQAEARDFVIPDAAWQQQLPGGTGTPPVNRYAPDLYRMNFEGIETRDPVGYDPTDEDLEPIRGIEIVDILPFVTEWPTGIVEPETVQVDEAREVTRVVEAVSGSFPAPSTPVG